MIASWMGYIFGHVRNIEMRKLLQALHIVQKVSNEQRHKDGLKRLGKGYFDAYRINPYNPLSYITLLIFAVVCIICFGVVGIWKQIDGNPFKWN